MNALEPLLNWPYLIPTVLAVALVLGLVIWGTRARRRTSTFEELAAELHLTLENVEDEQTSQAILAPLAGLHVMNVATGREVRHRLIGKLDGFDVQVIDTIVGGWYPAFPKRALSHEQTHTLIVLRCESLSLPPFAIAPKYVVADVFDGRPTTEVYLGPRFARHNRMTSPDEMAVREVVTDDVARAAAHNRRLTIEARGSTIVAYEYGQALHTSHVLPALRDCVTLADLLRQAQRNAP